MLNQLCTKQFLQPGGPHLLINLRWKISVPIFISLSQEIILLDNWFSLVWRPLSSSHILIFYCLSSERTQSSGHPSVRHFRVPTFIINQHSHHHHGLFLINVVGLTEECDSSINVIMKILEKLYNQPSDILIVGKFLETYKSMIGKYLVEILLPWEHISWSVTVTQNIQHKVYQETNNQRIIHHFLQNSRHLTDWLLTCRSLENILPVSLSEKKYFAWFSHFND